MISLIENNHDSIFISIAAEKPTKETSLTKENMFSRKMIARPAQKGDTSLFYALNIIRFRVGKYPIGFRRLRKIEILASNARKSITNCDQPIRTTLLKCINAFSAYLNKTIALHTLPTDDLGLWKALEYILYRELYQMPFSTWTPSEEISSLISSLHDQGPIIVNLYQREKINNHVVIVGAKVETRELEKVYYLSPEDGGKNLNTTTYDTFKKLVLPICGSGTDIEESHAVFGWQAPFID